MGTLYGIKKISDIEWEINIPSEAFGHDTDITIKAARDGLVIDGNLFTWDELLAARDKVQGFTELGIRRK